MKISKNQAEQILHQTHTIYNAIADDFSNTRSKWWTGLEKLVDFLPEGGKVLDVGCGNGRMAEVFNNKASEYLGVDNSEELIKIAQKKYTVFSPSVIPVKTGIQSLSPSVIANKCEAIQTPPSSVIASDSEAIQPSSPDRHSDTKVLQSGRIQSSNQETEKSLDRHATLAMTEKENNKCKISFAVDDITDLKTTGQFDLIIMIAVLHHLPTEELRLQALRSVYKLLKPGGHFVMYNWHLWSWGYRKRYWKNLLNFKLKKQAGLSSLFDALIPWKPLNETDMRYVHSFTKHELRRLLKQVGFTVEDIYYDTRGKRTNFIFGYNTVVISKNN